MGWCWAHENCTLIFYMSAALRKQSSARRTNSSNKLHRSAPCPLPSNTGGEPFASRTEAAKRRAPRRRAVVIGCNYARCGEIRLNGAVNDAHLFALALVNLFDFHPKTILLLTDEAPSHQMFAHPSDRHLDFSGPDGRKCAPERGHIIL